MVIFFDRKEDFFLNNLKEKGKVEADFDFNSGNNPDFLSVDQIKKTL